MMPAECSQIIAADVLKSVAFQQEDSRPPKHRVPGRENLDQNRFGFSSAFAPGSRTYAVPERYRWRWVGCTSAIPRRLPCPTHTVAPGRQGEWALPWVARIVSRHRQ